MRVEKVKQFSVFMPNKPGALSRLASLFRDKNIDILGIASEVSNESGLIRITLANDADASAILSKAGFASVETSILSVELDDQAGHLLEIADALAAGKINITTMYGTSSPDAKTARILIAVENTDRALTILEDLALGRKAGN